MFCFYLFNYVLIWRCGGRGGGVARTSSIAFSGILAADWKMANYWFGSFGADWTITSKDTTCILELGKREKALGGRR